MTEDRIPKHEDTSGSAGSDEPEAKGARAGKPGKPEPRRAGQVVERGKNKFLIRVFVGKDASGKRHWHNETFHGKRKLAEARQGTAAEAEGRRAAQGGQ
jgi:hypothetical protein